MVNILSGFLVGIKAGFMVIGAVVGIILGLLIVCAIIGIVCQIIALFVGEPRKKNAEGTEDGK